MELIKKEHSSTNKMQLIKKEHSSTNENGNTADVIAKTHIPVPALMTFHLFQPPHSVGHLCLRDPWNTVVVSSFWTERHPPPVQLGSKPPT